jgi:hypothetical protein
MARGHTYKMMRGCGPWQLYREFHKGEPTGDVCLRRGGVDEWCGPYFTGEGFLKTACAKGDFRGLDGFGGGGDFVDVLGTLFSGGGLGDRMTIIPEAAESYYERERLFEQETNPAARRAERRRAKRSAKLRTMKRRQERRRKTVLPPEPPELSDLDRAFGEACACGLKPLHLMGMPCSTWCKGR